MNLIKIDKLKNLKNDYIHIQFTSMKSVSSMRKKNID